MNLKLNVKNPFGNRKKKEIIKPSLMRLTFFSLSKRGVLFASFLFGLLVVMGLFYRHIHSEQIETKRVYKKSREFAKLLDSLPDAMIFSNSPDHEAQYLNNARYFMAKKYHTFFLQFKKSRLIDLKKQFMRDQKQPEIYPKDRWMSTLTRENAMEKIMVDVNWHRRRYMWQEWKSRKRPRNYERELQRDYNISKHSNAAPPDEKPPQVQLYTKPPPKPLEAEFKKFRQIFNSDNTYPQKSPKTK